MAQPNLDDLLKAGVHFGHQTRRWNPKMRRFIFAERNGIHIIDLQKTLRQIELAQKLAREVILRGDNVLFVCTKRQLSAIVKDVETGSETGGEFENYTKKEQLLMTRQRDKLAKNLSGIKNMTRIPGLMFVIDSKKERIAVSEANKLGIPIVAIVDTNADPDVITVPIAGNDDAIRSVDLITKAIADSIVEARREAPVRQEAEEGESNTYSSDRGMETASGDEDRRRRRRPRRRRAKPEAIAARLKSGAVDEVEADPAAVDEVEVDEGGA